MPDGLIMMRHLFHLEEFEKKLGYMTQDIMKYNGPRYDKDGVLRDNNNFIILIPRK